MIQKLRRKFILVNMLLVSLVLLAVFAVLLGTTYQQLKDESNGAMRLALERPDGDVPRFQFGSPPPDQQPLHKESRKFAMIPVVTATLDGESGLSEIKNGDNVAVSEEILEQAVSEALSSGRPSGVLNKLGLRYLLETAPEGERRVAFVDLSWERDNLTRLVGTSLLVGAGALAVFFLISLFLSSLSLKPAERAWEQQRQFVADASHELKTPLTVILANTGIVLAHQSDTVEAQSKWLTYTQEEATRMKGLVDDLLFLAKSDAGRQALHPMEFSLSDLALGCLLPFESVAFEAGVTLESDIAPDLRMAGDEAQLRRLVMILLDNAVKYAGAGGAVTLDLCRSQEKLKLSVHNTGAPIPPKALPHLFERFYRVDSARGRSEGGYGLGLAIAKSIVDAHHGKISAASGQEAGTTFTVLLPGKPHVRG